MNVVNGVSRSHKTGNNVFHLTMVIVPKYVMVHELLLCST